MTSELISVSEFRCWPAASLGEKMTSIPEQLTPDQAMQITAALLEARKYLRDATSSRIYSPNYARSSASIAELLQSFDVDPQ